MSKTIAPQRTWSPLDIDGICKLYEQTKTGTWVRQGNRVAAVHALTRGLNHLLAQSPRILFQQGQAYGQRATADGTPVYRWRFQDQVDNERTHHYQLVVARRSSGTGASYAQREGDATVKTPEIADEQTFSDFPEDTFFTSMTRERGAATASPGYDNEGITTVNEFSIVDVCVHTAPLQALEVSVHNWCPSAPAAGGYVVAALLEAIRSKFQELREHCLPVLFGWHAQGGGSWATPASSDVTALVTSSTSYVNVMDQTVSARSATSPPIGLFDVYRCGAGLSDQVPIETSILAAKVDGGSPANASFKIEGPDHVASNYAEETAITGAATWYDLADHFYGNAEATVATVSTERNKADAFFKVGHADDTLYLYAVDGCMRWTI